MLYYKSPQRLEGSGSRFEFTASRPYWINSYFIPPIDLGQRISLTVLSDRAGATTVVLAYYDENLQGIVGPPLVDVIFAPDQKGLVAFTKTDRSGPYFLTIDSSYLECDEFEVTEHREKSRSEVVESAIFRETQPFSICTFQINGGSTM